MGSAVTRIAVTRIGVGSVLGCAGALSLAVLAAAEAPLDWSAVPRREVMLFYPGQASWEWNLTEADHSGGPKLRKGKDCQGCHAGEETVIGEKIARGEKLDPAPVSGAHGALPLSVQVAQHGGALHWRFEWPRRETPRPAVPDAKHAAQLALLIDDGQLQEAKLSGCWGTCHDDLTGMASATVEVKRTKYLAGSRLKLNRQGGGDRIKPDADLQQLLASGKYMELWLAALSEDGSASAKHGYVLEKRIENDAGRLTVAGRREGERWVVELSRPLEVAEPGYKTLRPGTSYAVGFAVHEGGTGGRFHYVSLNQVLRLDAGGGAALEELKAEKP